MSTNSSPLIDISGKLYSRPGFMPLLLFKCFSSGSCCFSHPSHHSFCSSYSAYSQSSHLTSQKWTSCSCPSPSDCRSQSSHFTSQKWTSCSCPYPSECRSQSSHLTIQKWTSCSCPSPSDCRSQSSHLTNQKWTSCSCPSPSECEGRCGHWEGPCRGPTLGWDLT